MTGTQVAQIDIGPCVNCRNFERCTRERICCDAFVVFARAEPYHGPERWAGAPRYPSAAIMQRLIEATRRTVGRLT